MISSYYSNTWGGWDIFESCKFELATPWNSIRCNDITAIWSSIFFLLRDAMIYIWSYDLRCLFPGDLAALSWRTRVWIWQWIMIVFYFLWKGWIANCFILWKEEFETPIDWLLDGWEERVQLAIYGDSTSPKSWLIFGAEYRRNHWLFEYIKRLFRRSVAS